MLTEFELMGLDLEVFAIVYAYEPISVKLICALHEHRRDARVMQAAQRLIEKYLLVVKDDNETLEISKKVKNVLAIRNVRIAAKKKVETTAIIDGTPSIMCSNEVDGAWWYEAVDPTLSLIEREEKNESIELKNVTPLEEYREVAKPYERRAILKTCCIEGACETKEITKQIKDMQKGVENAEQCVLLMLGEAKRYDPFGEGRKIAAQKKKNVLEEKATELFQYIWAEYPRKTAKAQALKTYLKKFSDCKDEFEVTKKARKIYVEMKIAIKNWQNERNGEGRPLEYIPYFASWLNDTF